MRSGLALALALALAGCPPPAPAAPPPPAPSTAVVGPAGNFLPASRLETPELVAVEDGAGGFVATNLVTGSIVVGLDAGSFTGDSTEVRTTSPGAGSKQAWIPASLVVYERRVTGPTSSESRVDEYALADGVSVAAVASELRATEPSKVDVRALIERVKKKTR